MVTAGLAAGLATGGFPWFAREIAQVLLIVVMTFSLSEVSFSGLSARAESRGFALSVGANYGILSGVLILFALLSLDPAIRNGWAVMAAVPPAVAVIPLTSYLRGDVRRSLISAALLYLLGLVVVPVVTLLFAGQLVAFTDLVLQTLLLIGLPLLLSRPLRRSQWIAGARPTIVGVSFFILVLAVSGSARGTLLGRPELVASLSFLSFLRTFALGVGLLAVTRRLRIARADQVAVATFGTFKNLALTIVLAFSFFGESATLPSIVSLVFEIGWLAVLPLFFRRADGPSLRMDARG